jgi:hypothetical protein
VQGWGNLDPGGNDAATFGFPMVRIDELGNLGSGDLAWWYPGVVFRIDHRHPNGTLENLWRGRARAINVSDNRVTVECDGDLIGPFSWATYQPKLQRKVEDIGQQIIKSVPVSAKVDIEPLDTLTGIEIERTGSRADSRWGWAMSTLALAQKRNGVQWTLLAKPGVPKVYELVQRDLTTHDLTLSLGVPGVAADLLYDITSSPTKYYGEGQRDDGGRWYGAVFPYLNITEPPPYPNGDGRVIELGDSNEDTDSGDGIMVLFRTLGRYGMSFDDVRNTFTPAMREAVEDAQDKAGLPVTGKVNQATWDMLFSVPPGQGSLYAAHYETLAERNDVRALSRTPSGLVIGSNPNWNPETPVVDQFVGFGVGVEKSWATEWCRTQMEQDNANPEWSGTITLTTDPAECSRFAIRAGQNVYDPDFGDDGAVFHIASVGVDWQSGSVSLTVSTRGRDYMDLATIIERNRAARVNPSKRFAASFSRRSALSQDMRSGWDYEGGAGVIPETPCQGGKWTVIPVFVGEAGSVGELSIRTRDQQTEFCTAIFARQVTVDRLERYTSNPLALRGAAGNWTTDPGNVESLHGTGGDEKEPDPDQASQLTLNGRITEGRLLVYAAGTGETPDDEAFPCGYWPHTKAGKSSNDSLGSNLTGQWKDDAAFDYWTYGHPFLYVAVWVRHDCTISGRLYPSMVDGGM